MSNIQHSLPRQRSLKIGLIVIFTLLLSASIGYSQTQTTANKNVILQGSIQIQPTKILPNGQVEQIQPGTPVKIAVTVENKGELASSAGELFVRYAYAHPLEKETTSMIFETEKKELPTIEPGKKIEITFNTPHQIPLLLDFVRDDWSMREYQATALINQKEYLLGTLAITFSAYYYPGMKKEFPTEIK